MRLVSIPQGAIIKLNFSPSMGHEQVGFRPAVVISNPDFYRVSRLTRVLPISNREQTFPLHIPLDGRTKTTGSILTEHIRTVDLNAREFTYIEKCPQDKVDLALELLAESL
ncbi:type II toxin-antitoxin system PemK/MazF family toxin [Lactiplantibacillus daoliensis]|uniref:Type II toxin-antitoxin system PemK/MazF family toxin n=1 Tax=Lactiplantibacillus daoliensis TaxID=2559916 RepID=A0ABW1UD15_9LACO|nr:type II toxin-antitoxin system PemK/MazF family toxin [Lactiplantibacillus daoliensis]